MHTLNGITDLEPGFTTRAAAMAHGTSLPPKAVSRALRGMGYQARKERTADGLALVTRWYLAGATAPEVSTEQAMQACPCQCHDNTCGAADMDVAERTLRVIENLRPLDVRMIEAIEHLVDRAGPRHAAAYLGNRPDDEVPF